MPISIRDLLILLVEPSQTQQRVINDHLLHLGVNKVDVLETGKQAIETMTISQPDLVISSMYLPDSTGAELVQNMRNNNTLKSIPFMLISSETNFRYLDPIRQAGVIAILPKPFQIEQLENALVTTLDFIEPENLRINNANIEDLSILIVDDSKTARSYIKSILQNMGLDKFAEAENGKQAIKRLDKESFDLIVTDYNMPEMDGKELIRYIRNESDQSSIPIMMVTSETNISRLAAVENSGVSAICDKPFEPKLVRRLLSQLAL